MGSGGFFSFEFVVGEVAFVTEGAAAGMARLGGLLRVTPALALATTAAVFEFGSSASVLAPEEALVMRAAPVSAVALVWAKCLTKNRQLLHHSTACCRGYG